MARLVIEKGESFDRIPPKLKERLEELMTREFRSYGELIKELYEPDDFELRGALALPPERYLDLSVSTLPYVVTEYPLWGRATHSGIPNVEVGIVKVTDYTWEDVKPQEG